MLTGQRRSEISCLEWSEISNDRIELGIHRNKNDKPVVTPLATEGHALLVSLSSNNGIFVFSVAGRHRPIGNFSRIKDKLTDESGVADWTFHNFRRVIATFLGSQIIHNKNVARV